MRQPHRSTRSSSRPDFTTKQPVTLTVEEVETLLAILGDCARSSWQHARTTKSAAIRAACETRGRTAADLDAAIVRRLYQTEEVPC
jgi:hypothetical protein